MNLRNNGVPSDCSFSDVSFRLRWIVHPKPALHSDLAVCIYIQGKWLDIRIQSNAGSNLTVRDLPKGLSTPKPNRINYTHAGRIL
jgi:hypothetical protein